MLRLRVSDNRRFLVHADGQPFFWLGDTAWELFHRLDLDDAEHYLRDRAAKGFTVIQAVVLAEHGGLTMPNATGHLPLVDNDPLRPVEGYFQHVDAIVKLANSLGLVIGMLPTWGDKWNQKWGTGPELFNPTNARQYAEWLGRRYREADLIWVLGGDRPVETDEHRAIIEATAAGVRAGDGGAHLITFHPCGGQTSAQYFHAAPWLDLNMAQTGHGRNRENWRTIGGMMALEPTKPCLDGEPGYEDHPNEFKPEKGWLDEYDVRKSAWWALLAGACGHTYGCHDIWQFVDSGRQPVTHARTPWREAMHLPGAGQMQHVRRLLESRPYLTRVPAPDLLVGDPGRGGEHLAAARDSEGRYGLAYTPRGAAVTVDLSRLSGQLKVAWWYDPRRGEAHRAGELSGDRATLQPPSSGDGQDWVLVVDDAAAGFGWPGQQAD